ncbi:class V lanthionine synthetase subunit LxmK [Streptomyces lavendulae]|uniref:class V lanthionine synthetase subunit LxmK n=1 Tax=Streptomyces lavendulae TaxID=1914 RepID=UPI00367879F6
MKRPQHRAERFVETLPQKAASMLADLGMGVLILGDAESHPGRNENWAGSTERGDRVFIKQLGGEAGDTLRRFRRALSFEECAGLRHRDGELKSPQLLDFDETSRLMIFQRLECRSAANLMSESALDESFALTAGRAVASLHQLDARAGQLDDTPPLMPSLELLEALPEPAFAGCPRLELDVWRLLQGDSRLSSSLRELRRLEARAPKRPAHCDLRLDQLLVTEGELFLSDWEEFRMADPARDVGSFIGELLWAAVSSLPERIRDLADPRNESGSDAVHRMVIAQGAAEIERLRPIAVAFWDGYRSGRTEPDDGLEIRAAAFAGWHLIERVIASGARHARLPATGRAAMGISRGVLTAPEKFIQVLGLRERP